MGPPLWADASTLKTVNTAVRYPSQTLIVRCFRGFESRAAARAPPPRARRRGGILVDAVLNSIGSSCVPPPPSCAALRSKQFRRPTKRYREHKQIRTAREHHATRMRHLLGRRDADEPSLDYAQAIPGVSEGRGIGIINTLHLIEIPPTIEALEESSAATFPPGLSAGLRAWFRDLVEWMVTSDNGKEEAATINNHAVAFHLQLAVFAAFAGQGGGLPRAVQGALRAGPDGARRQLPLVLNNVM